MLFAGHAHEDARAACAPGAPAQHYTHPNARDVDARAAVTDVADLLEVQRAAAAEGSEWMVERDKRYRVLPPLLGDVKGTGKCAFSSMHSKVGNRSSIFNRMHVALRAMRGRAATTVWRRVIFAA